MALIETGTIEGTQLTFDIGYNFAGDGFSAVGTQVGLGNVSGVFSGNVLVLIPGAGPATVTSGNLTCQSVAPLFNAPGCYIPGPGGSPIPVFGGTLELHNTPFQQPPPDVISATFTLPFTATGHLGIGGGLDLTGQGILEVTWCPTCSVSLPQTPQVHYTFVADEPSSWGLMLAAVAALVIGRF